MTEQHIIFPGRHGGREKRKEGLREEEEATEGQAEEETREERSRRRSG